jgi:lipoate-protein ligase B
MPDEKLKGCGLCRLGRITYPEAAALQQKLLIARSEEKIGDILLVLEHPPTITLGRFAKPENILVSRDALARRGIGVYRSNRGGDVTFHCPGQLLMHPIMDLRRRPRGLRGFIYDLEEVALEVLLDYGIPAERWTEHPGLWVDDKQIGALGLHFSHGISEHGLSLNVDPDLRTFGVINLCGLPGKTATSIAGEVGSITMAEVEEKIIRSFTDVFHVDLNPISKEQLEGACLEPEAAGVV